MAVSPEYAPDAVYAARGPGSPLATDLSGENTNITFNTSWVYETSSTRADLTGSRTIDILLTLSDGNVGVLYDYHTSQMSVSAGVVTLTVNGSGVLSHTIQNITASTLEDYVMSWATEANPLTTGAGDAYRSELHIWNLALGTYEMASVTHAVQVSPGGGGSTMVFGAADSAGTNAYDDQLNEVRLSSAFHSSTETAWCYVYPTIGVSPVLEPDLRTLYDRWSGVTGTATGSSYDYDLNARLFANGENVNYGAITTPSAFSGSCWVRSGTVAQTSYPFYLDSTVSGFGVLIYVSTSGNLVFTVDYATTNLVVATSGGGYADDNEWHHLAFTWDGSATATNVSIYYDGTEVSYGTQTNGAGAQNPIDDAWYIGVNFDGYIALPKAWSSELTSTQVASIYERERVTHGVRKREFPVPDQACGLGDDGQLTGPIYAMTAKAQRQNDMLLVGPAVNEICTGAWAEDSTWTMTDPGDANYAWHLEFLRRRPVPAQCNRVVFRAFVQQNYTSAAALGVRFYVSDRPGLVQGPSSPDTATRYYDTVTRTADDDTGDTGGAWIETDPVRIARDDDGFCYFWIGFYPGSITDYRVRAWSVEPIYDDDPTAFGGGGGVG